MTELEKSVRRHAGEFLCERINESGKTRMFQFAHVVTEPAEHTMLPQIGRLGDFYDTFGSVVFYRNEESGDAAKYIAPISEWAGLHEDFCDWIEDLTEEERSENLPDWVDACLVIGETPHSGNYILMPTNGIEAGFVFEFDHDGFEFTEEAKNIVEYVEKLLKPDDRTLVGFASHMRFVDGDPYVQWWIRQCSDNVGHVASTEG
ncbi:MAG TPA: hypothetical protein VIF60_21765 [Burkholderiaceae bacterium]